MVLKVVLVLISPSVDVIRFNVELVGPVRVLFLVSILIELGDFHDGGCADMIRDGGEVLSNGLTGALIVGLTKNGRPPVLEEVIRLLTVEREHGNPISGRHAISVEFHTVAWNGFGLVRYGLNRL